MDAPTVARIAKGLRNDPEGLALFLNSVLHTKDNLYTEELHQSSSSLELAIQPMLVSDQINLEAQQLYETSQAFQTALNKPHHVQRVDLSDIETMEQFELTINYFTNNSLCNLRILTLPKNTEFCKNFVIQIFPTEFNNHSFVSLLRVIVDPDIGTDGLHNILLQIQRHFQTYSTIVRDMPQSSTKYGGIAAFLTIECKIEAEDWMREEGWFNGEILSDTINILYRENAEKTSNARFIMGLRTY